jgi:hypothetical protein
LPKNFPQVNKNLTSSQNLPFLFLIGTNCAALAAHAAAKADLAGFRLATVAGLWQGAPDV